jgi:hypothetical protein
MTLVVIDDSMGDGTLQCPNCGERNLHHDLISVFSRAWDDADTLTTIVEINGLVHQEMNRGINPSSRRSGLAIRFSCEHCDLAGELTLEQHKGTTYLKWRD